MTQRVCVIGAGSWGTTFAIVLADAGCEVTVWGRNHTTMTEIDQQHTNEGYLPGVAIPAQIRGTTDLLAAARDADLLVVAVPAQTARTTLSALQGQVGTSTVVVSLMKGVELTTDQRMSQMLVEVLQIDAEQIAVVSGPNLAAEIAHRQPTATVVASSRPQTAEQVAAACATSYFRPYTNSDVVGVELCGAVKNVIALAVGISQGRGLGYNTMATVITRGLAEITRLGLTLGADAATFGGLAGMGDLMATCASPDSRNHRLGTYLGQGHSLQEALAATGGTAEGVKTARPVLDLARRLGIEMPITESVVAVLEGTMPVEDLAPRLLARPRKAEHPASTGQ